MVLTWINEATECRPAWSSADRRLHLVGWLDGDAMGALTQLAMHCDRAETVRPLIEAINGDYVVAWESPSGESVEFFRSLHGSVTLYFQVGLVAPKETMWATTWGQLHESNRHPRVDRAFVAGRLLAAVEAPHETGYEKIARVPAGYIARVSAGCATWHRSREYVVGTPPLRQSRESEVADLLREKIANSVRRYAMNRSVAVMASGGLDSSIVAYEARKFAKHLTLVHFANGSTIETSAVRLLSEALECELHIVEHDALSSPASLPLTSHPDAPFSRQYVELFDRLRGTTECLMTGIYADELFYTECAIGGIKSGTLARRWAATRSRATPEMSGFDVMLLAASGIGRGRFPIKGWGEGGVQRAAQIADVFMTPAGISGAQARYQRGLAWFEGELVDAHRAERTSADLLRQWLTLRTSLESASLDQLASLSYKSGIGLVAPYSDPDLVGYCFGLPPRLKFAEICGWPYPKLLLRAAYSELLPSKLLARTGQANFLGADWAALLEHPDALAAALISKESRLAAEGIVDAEKLSAILSDHGAKLAMRRFLYDSYRVEMWLRAERRCTLSVA